MGVSHKKHKKHKRHEWGTTGDSPFKGEMGRDTEMHSVKYVQLATVRSKASRVCRGDARPMCEVISDTKVFKGELYVGAMPPCSPKDTRGEG